MKAQVFFILIAILAGAVLPFQAGLNIQLGKAAQSPIFAAFVSFLIGTASLLVYLLLGKFNFGELGIFRNVSPYVWLAGVLGAFYVAAVIMMAPKLGVALTFSLVVAGQMTVSLLVDHFGLMGLEVKHINWQKTIGVLFLIAGVIIIRKF